MGESSKYQKTVDAIHRASRSDLLRGPAKAAAGAFTKTNTATGAVVTDTVTGGKIATVVIGSTAGGDVSEAGSTYACPAVEAVHRATTDVAGGVDRHRD
jgi:hypothetical protein